MKNASLPQRNKCNLPTMSYASLINNLPESLRSSTGLAASLCGLSLATLVLPVLPLDSKRYNQRQQTVGLVELTPDEQIVCRKFSVPSYPTVAA